MWIGNAHLPIIAMAFTLSLSCTLTSLNRPHIPQLREQPILNAVFCLEAAIMYIVYMIVSRILSLALSCIEQSHHHHPKGRSAVNDYNGVLASSSYEEVWDPPPTDEENQMDDVPVWDEEEPPPLPPLSHKSRKAPQASSSYDVISLLYAQGIHREALISSMYLGGSGCFLALPALSFWDLSVTSMLLLSLALIGLMAEHTKHADFAPNQDKASVITNLRRFRWAIYSTVIFLIFGIILKENQSWLLEHTPTLSSALLEIPAFSNKSTVVLQEANRPWPIMLLLAFVSPLLLHLALPRPMIHPGRPSLMSPSQVLEAALPVSCLHGVLVLGWYTPIESPISFFQNKPLPIFLPMMIICPFCQVVILALILRGFRHKQTLPNVILFTVTTVIVQQVLTYKLQSNSDWILLAVTIKLVFMSACFLLYRQKVTSQGEAHQHEKVVLLNEITHPTKDDLDIDSQQNALLSKKKDEDVSCEDETQLII